MKMLKMALNLYHVMTLNAVCVENHLLESSVKTAKIHFVEIVMKFTISTLHVSTMSELSFCRHPLPNPSDMQSSQSQVQLLLPDLLKRGNNVVQLYLLSQL